MITVVIALISFAIAFVAGGVLSKVYFTMQFGGSGDLDEGQPDRVRRTVGGETSHTSDTIDHATHQHMLTEQRSRYRKRVLALNKVLGRHQNAQQKIGDKLQKIQKTQGSQTDSTLQREKLVVELQEKSSDLGEQLEARDAEIARLHEEFEPLQNAHNVEQQKFESAQNALSLVQIERDELTARINRLEAEVQDRPNGNNDQNDPNDATVAENLRADVGEMRERLATRDRQIHDLELQLRDGQAQISDFETQLESWKRRVSPLTRKLTQQRNVIQRLREPAFDAHSIGEPANDAEQCDKARRPLDELIDDLKEIRGIGPALERRLNLQGIRRFEQIAGMTEFQLADIAEQIAVAPAIVHRDGWIEQARSLAERQQAN